MLKSILGDIGDNFCDMVLTNDRLNVDTQRLFFWVKKKPNTYSDHKLRKTLRAK